MKSTTTIGKLAQLADINIETVRYYERIGMIEQPVKPFSGYRQYDLSLVNTLKFIKRSQQLGFTLTEIKDLLDLGNGRCSDVKFIAQEKRDKIQEQLNDLLSMKAELDKLIKNCDDTENTSQCAIIEILANNN
jgi:MerR family mercuric resistance operon transcriptional regulator